MWYSGKLQDKGDGGGSAALKERGEMDRAFQWKLEDIFADDAEWETTFNMVEGQLGELGKWQGRLSESAATLLACLQLRDAVEEVLTRLYVYAGLKNDQDTRASRYQAYRDRAGSLMVQYHEAGAFIQPEILAIPEEQLQQFLAGNGQLESYRHYLDNLLRSKAHVLPPEQERLLAMSGEIAQGPYHIFSMFNNADIKFPTITGEDGNKLEVTKGRYPRLMESDNRKVRKAAFQALYGTYGRWTNTLSATLSAAVKRDIFYARARNYSGALPAALAEENIPAQVYTNVVETINRNLTPLHRYMALRKRLLKVKQLQPWDLSAPLFSDVKFEMPYPEAVDTIRSAFHPLGETYLADLENSFRNGWIDVYENQGKRSGAYSWSAYGVHPYILLNYNNTLDDMFTTAHELGHAMHSFYTNQTQPYHYHDYTIFVAEVASTLNEALLMDYLLKQYQHDPQRKCYLLNEYIEQIRGIVYVQALYAEFEKTIHEQVEGGAALTAESLNELTRELYQRYFGPAFAIHPLYAHNWCRIPHYYYNFYVYKYATGFSAATALAQRILAGDEAARDAYLTFLSRGSSDYSIQLLKDAGVDMTQPGPIEATTHLLDRLLDEMEGLMNAEFGVRNSE